MRSKRRYWLLVVALVMPLTFAGAHSGQRAQAQSDDDTPARRKIAEDFTKAILVAQENYAGKVEWDRLTKSSILGMLHTLDPHSGYFDRKEWEDFQNDQRSRYFGIGSVIAQRNGKVYITSPFNGTPAHRSGIRFGDQIIEVDGQSTEGWSSSQVSSKLLGSVGTPVTVKLSRLGVAQPSLSKQIRTLETELGAPLLSRARGNIALTPAGEALLPLAKRILADVDTARLEVSYRRPAPLVDTVALYGEVTAAGEAEMTARVWLEFEDKTRAEVTAVWKRWRPH